MVVARNVFSRTFAVSDAVVFDSRVNGYSATLITWDRNASAALAAASVRPAYTRQ